MPDFNSQTPPDYYASRFIGSAGAWGLFELGATPAQATALKSLPVADFCYLLVKQASGKLITAADGRRGLTVSNIELDDTILAADRTRLNTFIAARSMNYVIPAGATYRTILRTVANKFGVNYDADAGWIVDPEE
jgi:hypothetical protein